MSDNGWSYRNPEVMAYVILARGAHHNYYMWYGGNHMGRSAAMGITNKYADGANLYSDMLPNEPKRSHLTKLYKLIDSISTVLLNSNIQADEIQVNFEIFKVGCRLKYSTCRFV